jgi:hypothetical protein
MLEKLLRNLKKSYRKSTMSDKGISKKGEKIEMHNKAINDQPNCVGLGPSLLRSFGPLQRR